MRTITTNVYSFNELNKQAQQNAINNHEYYDSWESERMESYKSAEKYYDLLHNIEGEISGSRLYAFIQNNIINDFINTNCISKHKDGKIKNCHYSYKYDCVKKRFSNIFKTNNLNNCPLTGVCYDFDFLQPIIDFIEKPTNQISNLDLELPDYEKVAQKDYDFYTSDEFLRTELQENDSEFTENGTLI